MIKCFSIVLVLLISSLFNGLRAAGDIMYVWAIHGLDIRSEPDPNARKLGVLSYGDSLEIIEETINSYTNLYIINGDSERHPVYLKSKWVQIISNDIVGYVINGYLLNIRVPFRHEELHQYLDRMAITCKTIELDTSYRLRFGEVKFTSSLLMVSNDKSISWFKHPSKKSDDGRETEADYVLEDIKYFKGFTKQELLVFLNPFYGIEDGQDSPYNGSSFYVRKNWKEYLWLTDGGMQEMELTLFSNQVIIFYYQASC